MALNASWLAPHLACPRHHQALTTTDAPPHGALVCAHGCRFPLVHGVPVFLDQDSADFPHGVFGETLAALADGSAWTEFGDSEPPPAGQVDAWVARMVGATNSNLYAHLVDRLPEYPIPRAPFPLPADALALDVGSGWGRWGMALAAGGGRVIGIDPSLRSVLAEARVARQLGLAGQVAFVVGDARHLPFRTDTFSHAFSYSVLQHFPKAAVRATLEQLRRVVRAGGETRLHLINGFGLRALQVQIGRGFRAAREFEVRYWRPAEMRRVFTAALGPTHLEVDGFFVQARPEDRHLLTAGGRRLLAISQRLTTWSRMFPPLAKLADNLFVISRVRP